MSAASSSRRPFCEECGDTHEIRNPILGKVRCPYCTKPRLPKTDWRGMNAAEKRRLEQQALSVTVVADDFRFPNLPSHLVSTDRVLMRWGSEGSGLPSENPDVYRKSLPPPLDDKTHAEVSTLVKHSETEVRRFAYEWYCTPIPEVVMSQRRGTSRRQLGRIRLDMVGVLKALFLTSRHIDLVTLIRFIPE